MTEHDDDRALDARLDALPRALPPGRELWTGIAARIDADAAKAARTSLLRRQRIAMGAAAVLVAIAASFAVVAGGALRHAPVPVATHVAPTPPEAPPSPSPSVHPLPPALAREVDGYQQAIGALEASRAATRAGMDGPEAPRIAASLGVLDRAIDATEAALAEDPQNLELRAQLRDEYQQKVDVLRDVIDLSTRT